MAEPSVTRYRWSRAYGLRTFGAVMVVVAVLWLLSALLGFPAWSLVVLAVVGILAVTVLLRLVAFPLPLLELSDEGYRLRSTRGGGVGAAPWSDVDSIASEESPAGAVMVIRLTDGRSSVVPLALLGPQAIAAEEDVHARLNTAFGYRRLEGS